MKKLLLLLLLLITNLSFAQDFSNKTIQQLQALKAKAVSNENYELAGKINTEIKKRENHSVSIAEVEAKLKKELSLAVKNENYEQASIVKKKLSQIKDYKAIDQSIASAVKAEDYQLASKLKKQKTELLKEITFEQKKRLTSSSDVVNTSRVSSDNSGVGHLMFILAGKKGLYYDVMVNDRLFGTISGDQVLVVENIPSGSNNVCVVYDLKYKHNVSVKVVAGEIQKVAVDYVYNGAGTEFSDFYTVSPVSSHQVPDISSRIEYSQGSQVDLDNIKSQAISNGNSSAVPNGREKPNGVYLYETQQLSIGGIFSGAIFPLKWTTMRPILKNIGLSYGISGGFAASSGFEDIYTEVTGLLGYKYETDNFSPYVSYNLGISSFNKNVSVLSRFNLGCEFFLTPLGNNGIGLVTEWNYGLFTGGGNAITLGFVFRFGQSNVM